MSKLSLVHIVSDDLTPKLVSDLCETYRQATNKFFESILVTQEQAQQWFTDASGTFTNFHGIPLEIEKKTTETATAQKMLNAILTGMHQSEVKDVAHVYRLLEEMKGKLS